MLVTAGEGGCPYRALCVPACPFFPPPWAGVQLATKGFHQHPPPQPAPWPSALDCPVHVRECSSSLAPLPPSPSHRNQGPQTLSPLLGTQWLPVECPAQRLRLQQPCIRTLYRVSGERWQSTPEASSPQASGQGRPRPLRWSLAVCPSGPTQRPSSVRRSPADPSLSSAPRCGGAPG